MSNEQITQETVPVETTTTETVQPTHNQQQLNNFSINFTSQLIHSVRIINLGYKPFYP